MASLACALALLGAAACGSDDDEGSGGTTAPSGDAPASGEPIALGVTADFPPLSYKEESDNELIGFSVSVTDAAVERLDRSPELVELDFPGLIPALQSGRIDVAEALYVTEERAAEVDFVPYMTTKSSVLTAKDAGVESWLDLCGKKVGYLVGSTPQISVIEAGSDECTEAGEAAIEATSYQAVAQELADIDSGRLHALVEDALTLSHIAKVTPDKYAFAFTTGEELVIAMAVDKGSSLLADLRDAVEDLVASDEYTDMGEEFGIPSELLLTPERFAELAG